MEKSAQPQEDSIREKIVLAAIDVIEREGFQGTTVRAIAKEAGLNSAAINYYFGTKENLVNLALKRTLDEGFVNNLREIIKRSDIPPREMLMMFLESIMTGCLRWPRLVRTHLYKPFIDGDYSTEMVERFHGLQNDLISLIAGHYPDRVPAQLKTALVQILSSIMFTGLMPGLFAPSLDADFTENEDSQKRYVRSLMDRLLPA